MDSSSQSCRDGDKWVSMPSLIVYSVNQWVKFVMFMCEGLVGESIVAICEFNELDCQMFGAQ